MSARTTTALDPTKIDTDGDGVLDATDLYPTDPNRWMDLPVLNYVTIDLSSGITNQKIEGVSIDDNNSVAFYYYDASGVKLCVVSGGTVTGPTAVKQTQGSTSSYPTWGLEPYLINGSGVLSGVAGYGPDETHSSLSVGFTLDPRGQPNFVYFGGDLNTASVSAYGLANDNTLWGQYEYSDTDGTQHSGYFIGSVLIPYTASTNGGANQIPFQPEYLANASTAIGTVPSSGLLAVWRSGSISTLPGGYTYPNTYTVDGSGDAFGLSTNLNSIAIRGLGAGQSHPFYSSAGGPPVDAYTLLPSQFINQVVPYWILPVRPAMNNAGDVLSLGQIILGDGTGTPMNTYLLWSPTNNTLSQVQINNDAYFPQMNRNQLVVGVCNLPLLNSDGTPQTDSSGNVQTHAGAGLSFQASEPVPEKWTQKRTELKQNHENEIDSEQQGALAAATGLQRSAQGTAAV
jgi:hypothetical protein